jgi:hypothetical protein
MENSYLKKKRELAHEILKKISNSKLIVSESGKDREEGFMSSTHMSTKFSWLKGHLLNTTNEDLHHALLLLEENKHITFERGIDIREAIISAKIEGEDAFKSEYYLNLNREDNILTAKNWYETENAKKQFEDYPQTKRDTKKATSLSIIAVIIAGIAVIVSLVIWQFPKK